MYQAPFQDDSLSLNRVDCPRITDQAEILEQSDSYERSHTQLVGYNPKSTGT